MTKTAARVALILALVGLGASGSAAYSHYRLVNDPTYLSFCDVSSVISCTEVYTSRYGFFAGVPVAIFGGLWFVAAALLAVAAMTGRPSIRESVPGYLFVLSTLALAVVLYLGYASFFVLNAMCLVCLTTYAAVIGLFIVSGAAMKTPMAALPRRAGDDLRVLLGNPRAMAVAVAFAIAAGATLALFPRTTPAPPPTASTGQASGTAPAELPQPTESQRAEFERWFTAQPRIAADVLDVPADGAKVVIVKFNDFQCPPCRNSHVSYVPVIRELQAQNPGQIKYVLKDFPLESECNVTMAQGGPHPASCEAAVAVRLAREHGREDAMIEWVFANQANLTPPFVKQGAQETGQVTDFDAKYAETLALVRADAALGQQLQVRSTPTFFLNGVKIEGALPVQYFEQAIRHELQRAQ
jgi:uncharacterized membrane protein/protein-disulfide isomerase